MFGKSCIDEETLSPQLTWAHTRTQGTCQEAEPVMALALTEVLSQKGGVVVVHEGLV